MGVELECLFWCFLFLFLDVFSFFFLGILFFLLYSFFEAGVFCSVSFFFPRFCRFFFFFFSRVLLNIFQNCINCFLEEITFFSRFGACFSSSIFLHGGFVI